MSLGAFGLSPLGYPVFGAAAAAWGTAPVYAGLRAVPEHCRPRRH